MKLPSVIVSAILVAAVALVQYLLGNIGEFGLPDLYAPIAVAALSAILKMLQERTPEATPRSISEPERPSYWQRVLYK